MSNPNPEVLVVGAGPAGLTLALDLTRRGIPVRIIDKAPEPASESRALAIHPRTLEVLEQLGVLTDVLAEGERLHGAQFRSGLTGEKIGEVRFDDLDTPFPFTLTLEQSRTERILAKHLALAGVIVERSTALTGIHQDDQWVTAHMSSSRESAEELEPVTTRFLVGCDGAHSAVRSLLGLSYEGVTGEERYLLADCRVDFRQAPPLGEMLAYLGEKSRLLFGHLPANEGKFWRVLITLREDDPRMPKEKPSLDDLTTIIGTDFPEAGLTLKDPTWVGIFKINSRMVDRFRVDRCFVAGDAAHIHSPSGGQGMNTGIQDAFNLSWKLALRLKGANDVLLESYEAERKPIAATVLRSTKFVDYFVTKQHGRQFAEARDVLLPWFTSLELVQRRIPKVLAGGEVAYRNSPIVRGLTLSERFRNAADHLLGSTDKAHRPLAAHDGPLPGDVVPDAEEIMEPGKDEKRFYSWLAEDSRHQLLIFPGPKRDVTRFNNLYAAMLSFDHKWSHVVRARLVTSSVNETTLATGILLDPQGNLARRLGADKVECALLIRPDGYLGCRSESESLSDIDDFLNQLLK